MTFTEKVGVLLRDPEKLIHFCQFSQSRLFNGQGVAKIPHGGRICVSSFSEYLSVYGLLPDEGELAMIQKFLGQSEVVLDLGANVGVWTVLMSKANPKAKIHSFEPNPATYSLLQKNAQQNNCSNVSLNNAAVSDAAGQLNFEVPKNASIFGRVAPVTQGVDQEGRFADANSFKVPALRLSEYCRSNSINEIGFFKIDIEGHELAALRGLEPLLSQRKVKAFYIETMKANHDRMGTNYSELLGFIYDCGYRFHVLAKDGNWGPSVSLDRIEAHNHLCLPL